MEAQFFWFVVCKTGKTGQCTHTHKKNPTRTCRRKRDASLRGSTDNMKASTKREKKGKEFWLCTEKKGKTCTWTVRTIKSPFTIFLVFFLCFKKKLFLYNYLNFAFGSRSNATATSRSSAFKKLKVPIAL